MEERSQFPLEELALSKANGVLTASSLLHDREARMSADTLCLETSSEIVVDASSP